MAWWLGGDGNYGTPNEATGDAGPRYTTKGTPPQKFDEDDGTFQKAIGLPTKVEAGTTARARFYIQHYLDGPIQKLSSFTSPLVLAILDRNGQPYSLGVTVGTVTADPSANGWYYSLVALTLDVPAGAYIMQWSGSYTPKAGGSPLTFLQRCPFRVKSTIAPSQYFMKDTRKFG